MTIYRYKAIDQAGRKTIGQMDAANEGDLELRLSRMGLDLITLDIDDGGWRLWSPKRVAQRELILFCFQLEQLINAGVPLMEALMEIRDTTTAPYFQKVLGGLVADLEGGKVLSQAMQEYPQVFNAVFVSLIAAGEKTGQLPMVFQHLSQTLKWQDELFSHTKRLLLYPLILLVVVSIALVVLLAYLVPEMVSFLNSLGQALPWTTRSLIAISDFVVNDGWWALLGLALLCAGLAWLVRSQPAAAYQWDALKLKLPITGEVVEKAMMARFSRYFALMYQAGIPVLDALKTCEKIVDNRVIADALSRIYGQIYAGDSLSQSFRNSGFFPPLVLRMISIGESTGTLDKSLMNASYFFDRDVNDRMQSMLAMLEPALTIILGLILLFIMASVLLPMYDSFSVMAL